MGGGRAEIIILFSHILFIEFSTGVFDATTASLVLDQLMYDGYKDKGTVPSGYKFKVFLKTHK